MQEPGSSIVNEDSNPPEMSLGGRLMNIYAAPTEVFDDIKVRPLQNANWLVPLLAVILVSIVSSMILYGQPAIIQGMKDAQEKKYQQMVDSRKMSQKQADQIMAMSESWMTPTVFRVVGILGAFIGLPIMLFISAGILWLLGIFALEGQFSYVKSLELVGLCLMISVPERIISTLLAIIYGNSSITLGPVLLVGHFDPENKIHLLLAILNVFTLWGIALWALGLARLTGKSFVKSLVVVAVCFFAIVAAVFGVAGALQKLGSAAGGK